MFARESNQIGYIFILFNCVYIDTLRKHAVIYIYGLFETIAI